MSTTATGEAPLEENYSNQEPADFSFCLKQPSFKKASVQEHRTTSGNTSSESDSFSDNKDIDSKASLVPVIRLNIEGPTQRSYLYYSMELCETDTLAHRLSAHSLTRELTCNILRQITESIAYIHGKNLVSQ